VGKDRNQSEGPRSQNATRPTHVGGVAEYTRRQPKMEMGRAGKEASSNY